MDLKEKSICLLASVAAVDMSGTPGSKADLFTVPAGKKCVITHIVVRVASGALGADYDFGDGANCDTWLQAVDLQTVIAVTDYFVIESNNIMYKLLDAADVFGVKPITGTAETATIDVFGYLYDA